MIVLKRSLLLLLCPFVSAAHASDWTLGSTSYLQFDVNRFDSDRVEISDDASARRIRLGFEIKHASGVDARAEYDVPSNTWTDLFARYRFGGGHGVRIGQFRQPFNLDQLTSGRWTMMQERALPSALAINRRLGVDYQYVQPNWTVTASAFGQTLGGLDDGQGLAMRGTWLAWREGGDFLHFGMAVMQEEPDIGSSRFSARPEAGLANRVLVDSGRLAGVDRILRSGVEGVWVGGPYSLQAEYLRAEMQRDAGDFQGQGYYLQGSWFVSGHQRRYKDGVMDGPKIEGDMGIELALRWSHLDLDDGAVQGGRARNVTAGINLYPRQNLRFTANYVLARSERRGLNDDPSVLELRAQLLF